MTKIEASNMPTNNNLIQPALPLQYPGLPLYPQIDPISPLLTAFYQ